MIGLGIITIDHLPQLREEDLIENLPHGLKFHPIITGQLSYKKNKNYSWGYKYADLYSFA